jgi:tetratricopeptide (TPR) repeat protein
MPSEPRRPIPWPHIFTARPIMTSFMVGVFAAHAAAADPGVASIRSKDLELHYRLPAGAPDAVVELWYTRDRGATWQSYGVDEDRSSPIVFSAPAEGLYGLTLVVQDAARSMPAPAPRATPQRWVFVDYTPPLLQLDEVEVAVGAERRTLSVRWTAHDEHFAARPITLAWRGAGQTEWQSLPDALPNLGRFEWSDLRDAKLPLAVRLTARDQAGNVTERVVESVPERRLFAAEMASPAPATRPAEVPTSRPAMPGAAELGRHRQAEELYQQGSWHLVRGQYALAAERFREALELNPDMLSAANDLAGVFYMQKDYDRALQLYHGVLNRNRNHVAALRGVALACVAKKDYAQSRDALRQLLSVNDKDAEAWLDLGDVLFLMGNQSDARQHWDRAAVVDPTAEQVIAKAKRRLELYRAPPAAAPSP